jgi:splicing factor 3B subunit 1
MYTHTHTHGCTSIRARPVRPTLTLTRVRCLCAQGLFHPARKVREVYWKIYNNLYIGSQDALVAAYPRIEDDDRNLYRRYELDYTL